MLKNKRGSQFVEASIVLPLLFLIVLSLIYALQFHFNGLKCQIEVQKKVLDQAAVDESLYRIIESNDEYSLMSKGLYQRVLRRNYETKVTIVDEGWMIRAGGRVDEKTER